MRRPKLRLGRPSPKDALAGFVTGLFSIPEGMAYASVMTGFTTGIALQIIAGVLGDATGYETDAHNGAYDDATRWVANRTGGSHP